MNCPTCNKEVDDITKHNKEFHDALETYSAEYEDTSEDRARDAWNSADLDSKKSYAKARGGDEELAYTDFYQLPSQMRMEMVSGHDFSGEEYDQAEDIKTSNDINKDSDIVPQLKEPWETEREGNPSQAKEIEFDEDGKFIQGTGHTDIDNDDTALSIGVEAEDEYVNPSVEDVTSEISNKSENEIAPDWEDVKDESKEYADITSDPDKQTWDDDDKKDAEEGEYEPSSSIFDVQFEPNEEITQKLPTDRRSYDVDESYAKEDDEPVTYTCEFCGKTFDDGVEWDKHKENEHPATFESQTKQWDDITKIANEGGDGSGRKPEGDNSELVDDVEWNEKENKWTGKTDSGKNYLDEGGAGSGRTALLPEQSAMANIDPNYNAFASDKDPIGDPNTSNMTEVDDSEEEASAKIEDYYKHSFSGMAGKKIKDEEEKKANEGEYTDACPNCEYPVDKGADKCPECGYKKETFEEKWHNKTFNSRVEAFEALGFEQGDSLKLADLELEDLSKEVKGALEVEDEDKQKKRNEDVDIYNDEGDVPDTPITGKDEIDYNIIGESLTSRTKYECEHCNSGFKSTEALMTHFNDIHVRANEFVIEVPHKCVFCGEDLDEDTTMGEHLAYAHGIETHYGKEDPAYEAKTKANEVKAKLESVKKKIKSNKVHIYSATETMVYEEFKEDEHPRDNDGKFGSGGGSSLGKPSDASLKSVAKISNKMEIEKLTTKDLIKQIKGGSKDWNDWGRNEKTEDAYAEIEKRNREVPRPTGKFSNSIFRDDPDAVSKMENKVKVLEERQEYWKQITKFPNRDYQNRNQLGDAKHYELSSLGANLRDARKKLDGIKAQQARGTTLTRKPTYPSGKKRFYYNEEPKGEALESWNKITQIANEEFKEDEHPRDSDGKFGSGGGSKQTTKEKPKLSKAFNKAKAKGLANLGEPKDDYSRKQYNLVNNLDGYPQHSSQLRSVGVSVKAPIMKAHLADSYPDGNWSVRVQYYAGGSSINAGWKGGGTYPYGAEQIASIYHDSGATDSMTDYFDADNYVHLNDDRSKEDKPSKYYEGGTLYSSREARLGDWIRQYLDNNNKWDLANGSAQSIGKQVITDNGAKGSWANGDETVSKEEINAIFKDFQDQEKKEGGVGQTAKTTPKAQTPASTQNPYHTKDGMYEQPLDPNTLEDLPVSSFNPNEPTTDFTKHSDKGDIQRAHKQMLKQKSDLDRTEDITGKSTFTPADKGGTQSQRKGEAYSNESSIVCPECGSIEDKEWLGAQEFRCRNCGNIIDQANEDDPNWDNDPDFQGNINGQSVEPSQYTQSGMDHDDRGRGDIDFDDLGESKVKGKKKGTDTIW